MAVELSRRFFLGGALSLIAASTFEIKAHHIGNMPKIWGDGVHDDTAGLGALLRGEPVLFSKDNLGVDEHKGVTFHNGEYAVAQTIIVPDEAVVEFECATFVGNDLPVDAAFFSIPGDRYTQMFLGKTGRMGLVFRHKGGAKLLEYRYENKLAAFDTYRGAEAPREKIYDIRNDEVISHREYKFRYGETGLKARLKQVGEKA